jgi:hypothetical protein
MLNGLARLPQQRLEHGADQAEKSGIHMLQAKELAAETIYLPPENPEG